jgi:hypothetical protein
MKYLKTQNYISYLGNASNPIVLESVIMSSIFHNYKQLLQASKEEDNIVNEDILNEGLLSLLDTKPEGKILFYRFSKKWHGLISSLHKEDREILLKMIIEICSYDNDDVSKTVNIEDCQSSIDHHFFLLAIIQQQKSIDGLNKKPENIGITLANRPLTDFM